MNDEAVGRIGIDPEPTLCTGGMVGIYELQEAGEFDGCVSLEYHPSVPLPQTMTEVRQLANFS